MIIYFHNALAGTFDLKNYMEEKKFYSRTNLEYLRDGKVIAHSEANDPKPKTQSLVHYVAGIHKKTCTDSAQTLGKYEEYKNYIPYLEKSEYDGKKIHMILNAKTIIPLLPEKYFKFDITVEIDRIKGPGAYKYVMGLGIFQGLHGFVTLTEMPDKKCLYHINADWEGQDTGLPNLMVKMLTEAISKKGFEKLFTVSGSQPN